MFHHFLIISFVMDEYQVSFTKTISQNKGIVCFFITTIYFLYSYLDSIDIYLNEWSIFADN